MKNFLQQLSLFVAAVFAVSAPALAQSSVQSNSLCVYQKNGEVAKYAIDKVDSVVVETAHVTPENLQAVDLGLTVKWANINIGASTPEGYGEYYAWGETESKDSYTKETYMHRVNDEWQSIGENIGGTKYDVAHVKWGGDWRMPSIFECADLVNKCTWTWTSQNGVNGFKVTGPSGNSIFLPAGGYQFAKELSYRGTEGYYWSSTYSGVHVYDACFFIFYDGHKAANTNGASRSYGHTIRAVCP